MRTSSRPLAKPAPPPSASAIERQQVAAVCYRAGARGLEFLLVQTRRGRWIFPKGGVEPGLTQAQSAALEAYEEAGVHGRIEEMPFARYHRGKSNGRKHQADCSPGACRAVTVHLCEVSHLELPQEADRNPTWFSPENAKRRLVEDRRPEFAAELVRVVDRAVARIQRLRTHASSSGAPQKKDGLQQVTFEAFLRDTRRLVSSAVHARAHLTVEASQPARPKQPVLFLGSGASRTRPK